MSSCVIYVKNQPQIILPEFSLVMAQKIAIDHQLPIAVVYCMLEKDFKIEAALLQTEKQLRNFNIPLMVLVGDQRANMTALVHHVNPQAVLYEDANTKNVAGSEGVCIHPYKWPGTIIPVAELFQQVIAC